MALPVQTRPAARPATPGVAALVARDAPEVLVVAADTLVAEALALAISSCGLGARVAADLPLWAREGPGGAAVVLAGGPSAAAREVAALVGEGRRVAVVADHADPGIPALAAAGAEAVVPAASDLNSLVTVLSALSRPGPVVSPVPLGARVPGRAGAAAPTALLEALTPREGEILSLLASGRRAAAIARLGFVSLHTVRTQIRSILRKLGVHSQLEAVAIAHRAGWPASRRVH
ncbi:MAG: LuxR C-terminal-related transcriptional regulator [Actinobacteria bacterium]|nr:LuxR C-terminal-related transcriptional regulator [Actinomycetota bacterium]